MPPSTHSSRFADQVSFGFLLWMVLFAILVSTGGITYALLKNSQVAVRTEINNLHREIAVSNLNTNQHRAKTNALTNEATYFAECIFGEHANEINPPEASRDSIRLVLAEIASAEKGAEKVAL